MKQIEVIVKVNLLEDASEDEMRDVAAAVVDGVQHPLIESTELIEFAHRCDTHTHYFPIIQGDDDHECCLHVTVTHEGLICDVIEGDESTKTWGATAQEIADGLCHGVSEGELA
jgi:hypothetical protein